MAKKQVVISFKIKPWVFDLVENERRAKKPLKPLPPKKLKATKPTIKSNKKDFC